MNSKRNEKQETNYKIIYQKIKEEIKSVVINRLLNQIEQLSKKYEKLRKENLLIKNDLIYILKRVFLNKNDYINLINNNISNINSNYQSRKNIYSANTSFFNSKSYNSFKNSTEAFNNFDSNNYYRYNPRYNYNNNKNDISMKKKHIEERRYSIDDDTKKVNNTSNSNLETSLQFNMQNKIDYYLKSLYKHNFAEECASGTTSAHLLNKEQSIYDELFSNKPNRNKSLIFLKTDSNFYKVSSKEKNRKNSNGKYMYLSDESSEINNYKKNYGSNNRSSHRIQKNRPIILKVHKKANFNKYKYQSKANENYKKINSGSKSTTNISTNSKGKNLKSMNNRSRFLINKI
jgi:hypothetical protein